jgi:DNA-binding LytR/AlgR family response regulator
MEGPYTIVVVDDEEPALELIAWFIGQIDFLTLKGSFSNAESALAYLENDCVDILVSGLELARKIHGKTKVIFATAFENYAVEGFNLAAVDYLLKPFARERFEIAILKAIDLIQLDRFRNQSPDSIVVKVNYSNRTLILNEVSYVESINNTICIHLTDGESILFRESLRNFEERLPSLKFCRIHRSYIVPKDKITAYNAQRVLLNTKELPVSPTYKNEFLAWMMAS